jgi:hypothetical protein
MTEFEEGPMPETLRPLLRTREVAAILRVSPGHMQRGDDAVTDAMERYELIELAANPPGWGAELDSWQESCGEVVVEFPTSARSRMAPACDRFRTDVLEAGQPTTAIRCSPATSAMRSRRRRRTES